LVGCELILFKGVISKKCREVTAAGNYLHRVIYATRIQSIIFLLFKAIVTARYEFGPKLSPSFNDPDSVLSFLERDNMEHCKGLKYVPELAVQPGKNDELHVFRIDKGLLKRYSHCLQLLYQPSLASSFIKLLND
jgi:hypothetical protein